MNDKEWFKLFDETASEFKWFFIAYGFEIEWESILKLRNLEQRDSIMTIMNNVWYYLPGNKFNIKENPSGWSEFLRLIEY
jgi:hypothetical protein